jgi:hypothetical protein
MNTREGAIESARVGSNSIAAKATKNGVSQRQIIVNLGFGSTAQQ